MLQNFKLEQVTKGIEPVNYLIRHFKGDVRTACYNELDYDVLYLLPTKEQVKAKYILDEYYQGAF